MKVGVGVRVGVGAGKGVGVGVRARVGVGARVGVRARVGVEKVGLELGREGRRAQVAVRVVHATRRVPPRVPGRWPG